MKTPLLLVAMITLLASCMAPKVVQAPPPLPHDEYLALEILNPRAAYDTSGAFITTVYLIRNISKDPVSLWGGPQYRYLKGSVEGGSSGPKIWTGKASDWIMYGFGAVSDFQLKPGQALSFVSETQFGKLNDYPLTVRFDRYDGGMSMPTAEKAAGLKYYVRFNLSYVIQPVSMSGESRKPSVSKSVQLDSPIIPITPDAQAKK